MARSGVAILRCGAAALCLAAVLPPRQSVAADSGRLIETGSSLLYPLFNIWIPAYRAANPGMDITPQSTGSGTGMSQAISGLVQIGGSDAYVSDALMKQHPGILNIPLAISSQMINYNLPGLNGAHLKLSGPVLAGIYQGKITKWNDPEIAKINPGVSLPDHAIVPVHRTDGSGDTFLFTQYLSASDADWKNSIAYGTTISWPSVSDAIGAVGNQGMVHAVQQAPYSVAYIGISFKGAIVKDQIGEAMLQNQAGQFVLSDAQTVGAAAAAKAGDTPKDERVSLIFSPGANSYPIINYEYAVVSRTQSSPHVAKTLRDFLDWAISAADGNSAQYLDKVSFVPLPSAVRALSKAQIARIGS